MPRAPRVYLAGPDVFDPDPIARGRELKTILQRCGLEGVFPLDAELKEGSVESRSELGLRIHAANEELIRSCNAVLANLTPFRGPSADVGTVYEIGYARGLGKTIVGYTRDPRPFLDRTVAWVEQRDQTVSGGGDEPPRDGDGQEIEGFGLHDNLMIDGAIAASGGVIVAGGDDLVMRAALTLAERLGVQAETFAPEDRPE